MAVLSVAEFLAVVTDSAGNARDPRFRAERNRDLTGGPMHVSLDPGSAPPPPCGLTFTGPSLTCDPPLGRRFLGKDREALAELEALLEERDG